MKTNTFIDMIAAITMTLVSSAAMARRPGHGWRPGVAMGYGDITIFWIVAIIAVAGRPRTGVLQKNTPGRD